MMVFWIVAGLLLVAALLFLLPPLLQRVPKASPVKRDTLNISVYRDQLAELENDLQNDNLSQEQYEQGRQELERRLLEDVPVESNSSTQSGDPAVASKLTAIIVGIAVPICAIAVYIYIGTPAAISPEMRAESNAAPVFTEDMSQQEIASQVAMMVEQLAQRLKEQPDDVEGWVMLGRSYFHLSRFDEAMVAFERAVALNTRDPQLLTDYADALAMASGESLEGKPMELIERALAIDPNHQKALWLAGTAAYERADFAAAMEYWQRLYAMLPEGSQEARTMEGNIAEAESLLAGREPGPSVAMGSETIVEDSAGMNASVQGVVQLDPALSGQVDANDTVFIYARAPQGPRMPLAIMSLQVKDLPVNFILDDSLAMNPSMKISQYSEVIVAARITKTGNAVPQSGDIKGESGVIRTGSTAVEVILKERIP